MNWLGKRWFLFGLALVGVIAVAAGTAKIKTLTELQPEHAAGGCYTGQLPGFGNVRLSLFLVEPQPAAWLYREGIGATGYGLINSNSSGGFRVDVLADHAFDPELLTNATLEFRVVDDGHALKGVILKGTNNDSQAFVLRRAYEHYQVHQHSGLMFGRLGANNSASSQFPSLPEDPALNAMLNQRLAGETHWDVRSFTSGNISRQWEMLRYGSGFGEGRQDDQWQVRLLKGTMASFAVWRFSDHGGQCGNPTSWAGRNFSWRGGKLRELKLADLFRCDTNWENEIRRLCHDNLALREFSSPAHAVLDQGIKLGVFTLSPTGLQIYFNPYTLASGAEGEFVVHIPYTKLRPFLRFDGPAGDFAAAE
ncbi:MAG: hypothetical protein JWQ04_2219 [Pedosphaera sp.]|nr:hypothetical protein [Pedosphaera sp.]